MTTAKLTTLGDAVSRIESGSSVALGLAEEHAIPFAAGHEMIRQGIDDLQLIGPISDILFDQFVGSALVDSITAAWIGNVSAGTAHCFRRAVEAGELAVTDHSNFSISLALEAAAMGVPYLPTKTLLGSDILAENERMQIDRDPFSGERIVLVPALSPDWTIVHVQRADRYGNAHLWGNTGCTIPAVRAADDVIVTAEAIVDTAVIRSDPSRTVFTHDQVSAVVECPFGAHPSPVVGAYRRDHEQYMDYHRRTGTERGYDEWASRWIFGVADRTEYAEQVDADLSIEEPSPAAEVTYGQ